MLQIILICVLIILGLVCLVIESNLESDAFVKPYLNGLSSVLLITGVLTLLDKTLTQRRQDKKLREIFRIHDSIELMGIQEIHSESQAYNFTRMLEDEDYVAIVLNDGARWVGNNSVALKKRFDKNFETVIFTLDPSNKFTPAQADKTDVDLSVLQTKIKGTWDMITRLYTDSDKRGKLTIYALKNYPTVGLFLATNKAIFTLYQTSAGRTNVPLFEIIKTPTNKSLYSFFEKDISRLKDESRIIYDSSSSH